MSANFAPLIKTVVCETCDGTGRERVSRPIHNDPFRLVETGMECLASCELSGGCPFGPAVNADVAKPQ
jgi:hypothetical protein